MLYFLQNMGKDLQKALITQLRNLWIHTSTAIEKRGELLPEPEALKPFAVFCEQAWRASMDLVDEIHKKQQIRAGKEK